MRFPLVALLVVVPATLPAQVGAGGAPPAIDPSAPADLKPLLSPHRSEMRLVGVRYNSDRNLLMQNYAGTSGRGRGGAPGGGRGTPPATGRGATVDTVTLPNVTISVSRLRRLKGFDQAWQQSLGKIDGAKLSADARGDLDSLRATVTRNIAQLDSETVVLTTTRITTPFKQPLIDMIEARLRLVDVKSEDAARLLTQTVRDIATNRALLDSLMKGLRTPPSGEDDISRTAALRGASTVQQLKANLASWFGFYNGYDPMFMWWVTMPYRKVDAAFDGYLAFLRDTLAPANVQLPPRTGNMESASITTPLTGKFADVPDLQEILNLSQDEMTDIVNRYTGRGQGGRGGRGGGAERDSTFHVGWLNALRTLDFDKLSRNAQVDYLYIRRASEMALSRIGKPLAINNPRKTDNTGIPGDARGRDGLIRDLEDQFIPYTPEQLMVLAEREFAIAEKEMLKASREMGFGDNWKAALEKTKTMHVQPGEQPGMIRDLIFQAIDYMRAKDLVSVPSIGAEVQRMSMMSPQAQLSSPFFLGGSQIQVSFPTDGMEFDARQQSMRGNNRAWSHATAFHEMIPGHNLSGYMDERYAGYRARIADGGPFYTEGWALYWELILYEMGFNTTPEERVGALVWRMHRCARIIFSLKFHMGQWSPQEAIDFLVARVGHERDNATAEVRRSFQGGYGPLYQAAYLLGGLQIRGLRKELVDTKVLSNKQFHDEILRQGSMPIALLRLAMSRQKLTRDMPVEFKFYGDLPSSGN